MYQPVLMYSPQGDLLGYGIKEDAAIKLKSTNIYLDNDKEIGELNEQLELLNRSSELNAYWPEVTDPEVVEILSRPDFMPIEMQDVEVVDDENSYYVYKKAQPDEEPEINKEASVLVYKTIKAPIRPTDEVLRIKEACEIVATERAGLTAAAK